MFDTGVVGGQVLATPAQYLIDAVHDRVEHVACPAGQQFRVLVAVVAHVRTDDEAHFVNVLDLELLPHEHHKLLLQVGGKVDLLEAVVGHAVLAGHTTHENL